MGLTKQLFIIMIRLSRKFSIIFIFFILNSCSVNNLFKTQAICNISKSPLLISADNNSNIEHVSGKIKSVCGLFSWGDASIHSAINISGDESIKLGRISRIDEERKLILGCGYYRIIVKGKIR